MNNIGKMKWILIFTSVVIIFGVSTSYLQSRSPLDLLYISIGIMAFISGFYIEGEKLNLTVNYFVAMFCVNLFQWLILIYILFNQVYVTNDMITLAIAPLMTISLIYQIWRSDLKYLRTNQNMDDGALINKMGVLLNNKARVVLISVGFLIMLVCLTSFLFSKSPVELFIGSVGMMVIVYGYYRQEGNNKTLSNDNPRKFNTFRFHESKHVNVTVNYFWAMLSIFIFQLLIFIYVFFNLQFYATEDVPTCITISFISAMYFFIQIRESDLKYFGKGNIVNTMPEENGYLVCNKCNRYYELQSGELPEEFTDQCECGGKLHYQDSI